LALGALVAGGCTPKYPKCDKDEHCREGEFCVNGMCQQCRNDKDCGKGHVCKSGRCAAQAGYCESNDDCPMGQACIDNNCAPCRRDGDCGAGGRCQGGKCLQPGSCNTDEDCPENHECQNGRCVGPPGDTGASAPCTPATVYFGFDEFVISSAASSKLQDAARCINSVPGRTIRMEGHCDPRGTEEYNLALGDRRTQAVRRYLERLGVDGGRLRAVSKGKLEATGTDAASWALDRKVQFFWE